MTLMSSKSRPIKTVKDMRLDFSVLKRASKILLVMISLGVERVTAGVSDDALRAGNDALREISRLRKQMELNAKKSEWDQILKAQYGVTSWTYNYTRWDIDNNVAILSASFTFSDGSTYTTGTDRRHTSEMPSAISLVQYYFKHEKPQREFMKKAKVLMPDVNKFRTRHGFERAWVSYRLAIASRSDYERFKGHIEGARKAYIKHAIHEAHDMWRKRDWQNK